MYPLHLQLWRLIFRVLWDLNRLETIPKNFNVDAYSSLGLDNSSRAVNEPNQLDNSLGLDSTINSLNLVHEPNELNLS
ncbi:hypothetical protein MTR_7g108755 [Medicago truncatula]|uniref:Uncharacterized protein n=1 Tax=Medicago truncatula TaxID=3880 RepID=A0A072U3U5_MEDTR|nr:hypothetical protein MTR_7g108755 [Medicago truncatula]